MQTTSLFRVILISGLIVAIIGIVAGVSLSDTLPLILQDYLLQTENEELSSMEFILFLILAPVLLVLLPISTIGLWKFKSWARTLYVVISVAFIPLYPVIGPVVMNGWEAMFSDVALMLEGVLIAMMFTGEISKKFKPLKAEVSS
ncbi:hypothetical protein ACRWQN_10590 [Shewanella sp. HL-SH8]|uniref:hypothetical protein n=1 Tax=Shewanella sp. HL-SH8 TaxID=3436242 RepID=UPI003EB9F93A